AISVLPTPGVRSDAVCLRGRGFILTGETLWIGVSSAFGMPGSDLSRLWKSLGMLKESVSPDDLVFPGYDVREFCFSTWKTEMEKNPDLLARDLEELSRLKSKCSFHLSEDSKEFARFNSDTSLTEQSFHKTESPFRLEDLERNSS